jgi:5-methylcytosine-specific restriction endonuclease McrA
MGYKYKAFRTLANWFRDGRLDPDIDLVEVFKLWEKTNEIKRNRRPTRIQPRFLARANAHNRRARLHGVEGTITYDDLEEIFTISGKKCGVCGTDKHLVFDHVVSMYQGGKNNKENLQVLCRMCNMEKGVN